MKCSEIMERLKGWRREACACDWITRAPCGPS